VFVTALKCSLGTILWSFSSIYHELAISQVLRDQRRCNFSMDFFGIYYKIILIRIARAEPLQDKKFYRCHPLIEEEK
jgi:hypothetical protein